jgi:hypothetical protein
LSLVIICPFSLQTFLSTLLLQIAGETFDVIKSNVLQGSKVILDVEKEGLDERTILALDAATKIFASGRTCFRSSDGKEHCFAYAQPGQCKEENSFGPEGRRQLGHIFGIPHDIVEVIVSEVVDGVGAVINSMKDIALGPVYQAAVDINNNAMKLAEVADAALDDIEAGAKIAAEGLMVGLETVARAGVWLAEWVDAKQCEIGMSFLLATLFAVNVVDPLPVGVLVSTTYLQGVAIAYLADPSSSATKKQVKIACDMVAQYYLEMILTLSTVQRAIGVNNQEALQDAISMIVAKNFEKAAAAFAVTFSGAAIVAGVTVNLATQLVCYDQLPQGTEEWGDLTVYTKVYTIGHRFQNWRHLKYMSWSNSEELCNFIDDAYPEDEIQVGRRLTLCPRSVYCPNGPLQPPDGGMRNFNSWAPIGGEGENMWINIGNQNPATELCKDHGESFKKERHPAWGNDWENSYDFRNVVYCCNVTDVEETAKPTATPTTANPTATPTTATPTAKPTASPTTAIARMQASVDVTNNAVKQAKVTPEAWDDIDAGARFAAQGFMVGEETVAQAGVWLVGWVNAKQCELGMSLLLGTLFAGIIVDPLPVGVAEATTHLQTAAIDYMLDNTIQQLPIACDLAAQYYLELIWNSTTVQNAIGMNNKDYLHDAISMTVAKNFVSSVSSWVDPFSPWQFSGAVSIVAGVTINLATQLACYNKLPQGTAGSVSPTTAKPTATPTTAKPATPTTAKPKNLPKTAKPTAKPTQSPTTRKPIKKPI